MSRDRRVSRDCLVLVLLLALPLGAMLPIRPVVAQVARQPAATAGFAAQTVRVDPESDLARIAALIDACPLCVDNQPQLEEAFARLAAFRYVHGAAPQGFAHWPDVVAAAERAGDTKEAWDTDDGERWNSFVAYEEDCGEPVDAAREAVLLAARGLDGKARALVSGDMFDGSKPPWLCCLLDNGYHATFLPLRVAQVDLILGRVPASLAPLERASAHFSGPWWDMEFTLGDELHGGDWMMALLGRVLVDAHREETGRLVLGAVANTATDGEVAALACTWLGEAPGAIARPTGVTAGDGASATEGFLRLGWSRASSLAQAVLCVADPSASLGWRVVCADVVPPCAGDQEGGSGLRTVLLDESTGFLVLVASAGCLARGESALDRLTARRVLAILASSGDEASAVSARVVLSGLTPRRADIESAIADEVDWNSQGDVDRWLRALVGGGPVLDEGQRKGGQRARAAWLKWVELQSAEAP